MVSEVKADVEQLGPCASCVSAPTPPVVLPGRSADVNGDDDDEGGDDDDHRDGG